MNIKESFEIYFDLVEDPRSQSHITYQLSDILFLLIVGMLCNCIDLEMIIEFAEEKEEFLKQYTELENIPCLSTISNILKIINPEHLELCLYGIFSNVFKSKMKIEEKQICIDGKTICSTATMKKHEKPMHIITALLADESVSLGQITVESKSNEIPAVRELIELLNVKGAVLTMDAMHCQKETAELIIDNGGDYVLQLKENQGNFYKDVYAMLDDNYMNIADKDCEYETFSTIEKSHGRIEKRTCYVLNEVAYFTDYTAEWKGLKKIFAVKREVEKDGEKTEEISCYLSNKNASAEELMGYTRKHWEIEAMHHILDVTYNEDNCQLYQKNAQENMNIFRKMGISVHKNYLIGKKQTIKSHMFNCLLNNRLLIEMLQFCNNR